MLAHELLRTKKDGLRGLKLSRKRKLEELHYATVIWQSPETSSQHQLYEQKERAFLDANDITKGRFFDEVTLPERPDFASLIPPKRPTTHQLGFGSPANKRSDARDSHSRLSPPREAQGTPKERDVDVEDALQHDRDLKPRGSRNQSPLTNPPADARKPGPSDASSTTGRSDGLGKEGVEFAKGPKSNLDALAGHSDQPKDDIEQADLMAIDDEVNLEDVEPKSSHGLSLPGESGLGRNQARQPSRSPGVAIPPQEDERKNTQRVGTVTFGEQASSPNSTVGHHSSNTPGATAISPDTSPENDFLDDEMVDLDTSQLGTTTQETTRPSKLVDPSRTDARSGSPGKQIQHAQTPAEDGAPPHSESTPTNGTPASRSTATRIPQRQSSSVPGSELDNRPLGAGANSSGPSQGLPAKVTAAKELSSQVPAKPSLPSQVHRPTMKIDTSSGSISNVGDATLSQTGGSGLERLVDSPLSIGASATPRRAHAASVSAPSPPERMTTRVSSGAIRHKSVSEILGGPPKAAPTQQDKSAPEKASTESSRANFVADPSAPLSGRDTPEPGAIRMRQGDRREKERERSKLSTVVFAKPQAERMEGNELATHDGHQPHNEEKDYLYSLFVSQAYGPPRCPPLKGLLGSAHKTTTTANACLDLRDQQDAKIMKRIYQLQYSNRWPLRQQERAVEPPRPKAHWDYLLDEMKWMRTDFREERKWKLVVAKQCADWCAEYQASTPEERGLMRIKRKSHVVPQEQYDIGDVEMTDDMAEPKAIEDGEELPQPTPDLVPSAAADTPSDSPVDAPPEFPDTISPAAIFSLSSEEVIFGIRRTPATEKILGELPLYQPFKFVPEGDHTDHSLSPDAVWKKDIVPVSRFVEATIRLQDHKPPKKRGRFDYQLDDGDDSQPLSRVISLTPEQVDVALFNPENKPIRDRIHPGHAFRPPSEFPMPGQNFFESRNSSQWTYAEDDELRKLVKEYSYNWSLISSCLSPKSLFSSGAERRTPWECFERWVNLEGLPSDMSKTQYFRAYHQRLESAQRTVMTQQAALQAQQGNNPAQPMRRRTTQPVRVERRRSSKYLALLDGMRKLAKKRESTMVKQQQASSLAAMRKPNDAAQPKPPFSTPQEFSRLKYDRELKMVERQEQYRLQVLAHQRAAYAQRSAHQATQQHLPNGIQGRNVAAVNANGSSPIAASSLPNGHPQAGAPNQARPHPPLQALPNGTQGNGAMAGNMVGMKGLPQGPMAGTGPGQPRVPPQVSPDNMRQVYLEATRVQEQQQRFLQQQRQQQQYGGQGQNHPQSGPHSSPNMGNMNPSLNNAVMNGAIQVGGNMGSPSLNTATMVNGTSGSPRMGQSRPLSNGVVPAIHRISNSLQASNPHLSPEQIQKLTTEQLSRFAMNAAVGNSGAAANYGLPNDGGLQPSMPQQGGMSSFNNAQAQAYAAQLMRAQQQQQNQLRGGQAGAGIPNGVAPNGSRSATPQNQRSGSAQAPGAGKSPRPPQAQISG